MKPRLLVTVSLAINLVLLAMMIRGKPGASEKILARRPSLTSNAKPPASTLRTNIVIRRFDWQSVEADEYPKYIANLRSIGCPEETIEDIVVADVFKMFELKKREACDRSPPPEYWRASSKFLGSLISESVSLSRRITQPIDDERNALFRSLGIDPSRVKLPQSTLNARESLLNFIPPEKREKILAINSRGAEELEALGADSPSEDAFEIYRNHTKELEQRIKQLFTPEEALQYDLRFSQTADYLRNTLSGFEPTEEEFVELFKLRSAYIAKIGNGDITVAEDRAYRDVLNQEVKAKLGEARFAEYDRTGDYGFQQLWGAAQKTGLPVSKAIEAFNVRRAAMQKAYELREATIDDASREAALSAIRNETERTLEATLGTGAWKAYGTPFNLEWLERISRRFQ